MGTQERAKLWLGKLTRLNPIQGGAATPPYQHTIVDAARIEPLAKSRTTTSPTTTSPFLKQKERASVRRSNKTSDTPYLFQREGAIHALRLTEPRSDSGRWTTIAASWSTPRQFKEHGPELVRLNSFAGRHLQFDPGAKLRPAPDHLRKHRSNYGFRT